MFPICFQIATLQIDPHMLWDGLAGAVGGGVISSIITVISERRSKRTEVALQVIEQFMSQYGELGDVLGLLDAPQSLQEPHNENKVRKFGDWSEVVSALCLENLANDDLLRRIGIPGEMKRFLLQARKVRALDSAVRDWKNLQEYTGKEKV
jgi:hypothetical protein